MAHLQRIFGVGKSSRDSEGTHWLSVSDLMAGLMMVFLFIAIALMRAAFQERDRIREIAVAYQENQIAIYWALMDEFVDDLQRWDAHIDRDTLAFEFQSPDVLFATGQVDIRPQFQEILDDFFPRYLDILRLYQDSINEIRVEGHTSSDWSGAADETEAYFLNMDLSQGRTRSVLRYAYDLPSVAADRDWVKQHFAAVGFSSSRVILDVTGEEDFERSRRVSFRVITNSETQIRRILEDN